MPSLCCSNLMLSITEALNTFCQSSCGKSHVSFQIFFCSMTDIYGTLLARHYMLNKYIRFYDLTIFHKLKIYLQPLNQNYNTGRKLKKKDTAFCVSQYVFEKARVHVILWLFDEASMRVFAEMMRNETAALQSCLMYQTRVFNTSLNILHPFAGR